MKFSKVFVIAALMSTSSGISLEKASSLTQRIPTETMKTIDDSVKDVLKIASGGDPFEKPCATEHSTVHHIDSGYPGAVVVPHPVV